MVHKTKVCLIFVRELSEKRQTDFVNFLVGFLTFTPVCRLCAKKAMRFEVAARFLLNNHWRQLGETYASR
jgi:hypothetical protein